jgi:uncharacterized phage protein (predicted DNA packaging)
MYIPLDLAKKHLNLEEDYHDDDEYILLLIDAAEQSVRVHVNEDLESIAEKSGDGCLPTPLINAMLLMIGNLYQNREIVGTKTVALPFSYRYLIDLYRNYNN